MMQINRGGFESKRYCTEQKGLHFRRNRMECDTKNWYLVSIIGGVYTEEASVSESLIPNHINIVGKTIQTIKTPGQSECYKGKSGRYQKISALSCYTVPFLLGTVCNICSLIPAL